MRPVHLEACAALEQSIHVQRRGQHADRRLCPVGRPGDHRQLGAVPADPGKRGRGVMDERRRVLLVGRRQRHPALDPVQPDAEGPLLRAAPLRVGDAAPGEHPVHVARADGPLVPQAVPVDDLPVEEVGHRRQRDVRVRAHVESSALLHQRGPHVVQEDERPDHPAAGGRQQHVGPGNPRDPAAGDRSPARCPNRRRPPSWAPGWGERRGASRTPWTSSAPGL